MIRALKAWLKKQPAEPIGDSRRGKKPLCAVTQNRMLGAHIDFAGGIKGKGKRK